MAEGIFLGKRAVAAAVNPSKTSVSTEFIGSYFEVAHVVLVIKLCLFVFFRAGGSRVIKGETLEDEENSDEGDEGDYTVYECPGLAPVSVSEVCSFSLCCTC